MVPGLMIWGGSLSFMFAPSQRAVMSSVPTGKRGQAGGISMTAQLMGGTLGLAACSVLLATTGSFSYTFFGTAALAAVILPVGWVLTLPVYPT